MGSIHFSNPSSMSKSNLESKAIHVDPDHLVQAFKEIESFIEGADPFTKRILAKNAFAGLPLESIAKHARLFIENSLKDG